MAREFIDGFEAGNLDLWDAKSSAGCSVVTGQADMDGTYSLSLQDSTGWVQKILTARAEIYVSFWYMVDDYQQSTVIEFLNGPTTIASVTTDQINPKYLKIQRGATVLATGLTPIAVGAAVKIGIHFKIGDSGVGVFKVMLNGFTELNPSPVDTFDTAATLNGFRFKSNFGSLRIDNVIVDNAAIPYGTRIMALAPMSGGDSTQYTASAGANWDAVNELGTVNDTDFVFTNTPNQLDLYNYTDLVGDIGDIKCIQVQNRAWVDGAAPLPVLEPVVKIGGVETLGANISLSYVAKTYPVIFETYKDALDSDQPLTLETVNAMQVGVRAKAS